MLQEQFCTVLVLQKHVSESVLCKSELRPMGSKVVVNARRAGLNTKNISGEEKFCPPLII